jgi:penicillin-insensitive murein endopeptidase
MSAHFLNFAARVLFLWLLLETTGAHAQPNANEVSLLQSLGFYSRGSLQNASALAPSGMGYIKLFPSRNRQFGSQELVQVLTAAARAVQGQFPAGERIQVGDLSAERGGKITKHASHQNGLDADLSYFRVNHREQPVEFENGFDEVFVRNGRVTENFDIERNWAFFNALIASGQVQRIFVDPAIKLLYCELLEELQDATFPSVQAPSAQEVLRRLRPISNHDDHSHVRLVCQAGNHQCVSQSDVTAGSGCRELRRYSSGLTTVTEEDAHEWWEMLRLEHDGG